MPTHTQRIHLHGFLSTALALSLSFLSAGLWAQATPTAAAQSTSAPTIVNSNLNGNLFYQLLIAELELGNGQVGIAYSLVLNAARKESNEELFKRAVEIAVRAQAGNDALSAVQAWRKALPQSLDAVRSELQILLALNRIDAMGDTLSALIQLTPETQRSELIISIARLFERSPKPAEATAFVEKLLAPYAQQLSTQTAVQLTMARMYLQERKTHLSLQMITQVLKKNPNSTVAAILAAELLPHESDAEALITAYLQQLQPDAGVQLAYIQQLLAMHRSREVIERARALTQQMPELAQAWLLLGMELFDLGYKHEAPKPLIKYLELQIQNTSSTNPMSATEPQTIGQASALLALAKIAIDQAQYPVAQSYLQRITHPEKALDVQFHNALITAHQGNMAAAQKLVQAITATEPEAILKKNLTEVRLLRQFQHNHAALSLLQTLNQQFPDTPEVLYELAMTQEAQGQFDAMEQNLRAIIQLRPNHAHAHNALGYSLADRGIRLTEALALIERALELMPGDPFITDSLGWAHFKMGNLSKAITLLRKAYSYRPDTEIASHLAEVLWIQGQTQEALELWKQAQAHDHNNSTLLKTLKRLGVQL
jgi:Flp pilus assembly protein TadD